MILSAICRKLSNAVFRKLNDAIKKAKSNPKKNISYERKIIVSGILPPPDALCAIIEEAGMRVAGNDVSSQARSYSYIPQETGDPAAYYADFYRNHYPCTTLLYSSDERLKALNELIEKRGARGYIVAQFHDLIRTIE